MHKALIKLIFYRCSNGTISPCVQEATMDSAQSLPPPSDDEPSTTPVLAIISLCLLTLLCVALVIGGIIFVQRFDRFIRIS